MSTAEPRGGTRRDARGEPEPEDTETKTSSETSTVEIRRRREATPGKGERDDGHSESVAGSFIRRRR